MATKQQLSLNRNLERDIWNGIWTALTSRFPRSRIATRDSSSSSTLETTTAFIIPFSTVTVFDTTVFQTTFVTVHASSLASLLPTSSKVRSSRSSSPSSAPSSTSTLVPSSSSTTTRETLPSVITQHNNPSSTSSLEIPAVMTSASAAPETTSDSFIGKEPEHKSHKIAIIGGLSGTIAGLLFIGVMICLVLRRRRRKLAQDEGCDWGARDDALLSYAAEKGLISTTIHPRPDTAMTTESPGQAFQGPPSTAPAVDEDHRMIRMSTCHWPRPFALGAGEGYRETVPAGQLRCTNPDLSRPGTPQTISGTPKTFFSRQRALFAGNSRSQPQQRHPLAQEVPTIKVVDPALSRECVSRDSNTPSFKSYPSISTVQVVQHRFPEDPFLTPTAEEPVTNERVQRPSATRTISASKTWSHIGSLLHPLRNRSASNLDAGVRASSHYSVDTESTARFSRRSDPFDLDRQSRNWNVGSESQPGSQFRSYNQTLYEGT